LIAIEPSRKWPIPAVHLMAAGALPGLFVVTARPRVATRSTDDRAAAPEKEMDGCDRSRES